MSNNITHDIIPHNRDWDKDEYINNPVSKNGINHVMKNRTLIIFFILCNIITIVA